MATPIFIDSYTDAPSTALVAHTPDLGVGYSEEGAASNWYIDTSGSQGRAFGAAEAYSYLRVEADDPTPDDQSIEVDVLVPAGHGGRIGVLARYTDADNHIRLLLDSFETDDGPNNLKLVKRVAGVDTVLNATVTYIPDAFHTLKLRVIGTEVRAWFDGVLQTDLNTTTTLATGDTGKLHWGNSFASWLFENLLIEDETVEAVARRRNQVIARLSRMVERVRGFVRGGGIVMGHTLIDEAPGGGNGDIGPTRRSLFRRSARRASTGQA